MDKWIPVSERLPEYHKEVVTCSIGGFIEIQSLEDGDEYWENQHGDWTDKDEVIAWMPLPEPYKTIEDLCREARRDGRCKGFLMVKHYGKELCANIFDCPLVDQFIKGKLNKEGEK